MKIIENIDLSEFPTTRYQGSKRKMIPWIFDKVKNLEFDTCLDAFGGTGAISYMFKKMGKSVTYNDILKFNYIIGKAIIENSNVKLLDSDIKDIIEKNSKSENFIQENFKGVYYLNKENKWLDNVSTNIFNMNHYPKTILEYKKSIAFYALFQSCMIKRPFNLFHRKNLYLRTRDVVRNFGNKISWDKSFEIYFKKFTEEVNKLVFKTDKKCKSINKSVFDISGNFDLVYLDPPYLNKDGSNETSNYLRCYHFLEGISNYLEWKNLIDYNSINLRFNNISENNFNKDNISLAFERVFEKFRNSIIVLSYKKGGIPSIKFLKDLMKEYKSDVSSYSMHYSYALNHQNGDKVKNREVLIIGK